ncbi:adenylate/guanylate cyclase domain-containing protein [Nisaea sp.]|uniref:adenylate/guanylate cyclase domain-containing protein n=1 Tax=Nisaea sp. TaxID=2024842 RepID=UPI0032EE9470
MKNRQLSYEELSAHCARLEERVAKQLVLQDKLNAAKSRIDQELRRFQTIQAFIEKSLAADSDSVFLDTALEAVIEAFEFEVALVLRPSDNPGTLHVAGSFGFDEKPAELDYDSAWFSGESGSIVAENDTILAKWSSLGLRVAITCPLRSANGALSGVILGGVTNNNYELYEPITADRTAAFTVMARQIGSVLNKRALNLELVEQNRRLELEHGRQLVLQRDLIRAKNQVDDELMRFKSIQEYTARTLDVDDDEAFFQLTLEAIIEAFELEAAVFMQIDGAHPERMQIVSQFGLENAPESLPYQNEWFSCPECWIADDQSDVLKQWSDLGIATAIICPFLDRHDELGGVILAGVTAENMDFYDQIQPDIRVAFSVLVRQAGGLWINRQLNAQVMAHNQRLASLTKSYSRFVPFQFLELLDRSGIEEIRTGDSVLKTMNVLFADIRGFTTLSERLGPTETFVALNEFLATMEPLIANENGFINQYLGDAIMALFPGSADAALRCAEAMLDTQVAFNREREDRGERPILFGLGINSGPLMIGALGGGERLDSNVIGDTANLASRVEGLTRLYGVSAIFTDRTHALLEAPDSLEFREIDRVVVKGRAEASTIFELLHPSQTGHRTAPELLAGAIQSYRQGDFDAALQLFKKCRSGAPVDPITGVYITRCESLIANPPAHWDGAWVLSEKS